MPILTQDSVLEALQRALPPDMQVEILPEDVVAIDAPTLAAALSTTTFHQKLIGLKVAQEPIAEIVGRRVAQMGHPDLAQRMAVVANQVVEGLDWRRNRLTASELAQLKHQTDVLAEELRGAGPTPLEVDRAWAAVREASIAIRRRAAPTVARAIEFAVLAVLLDAVGFMGYTASDPWMGMRAGLTWWRARVRERLAFVQPPHGEVSGRPKRPDYETIRRALEPRRLTLEWPQQQELLHPHAVPETSGAEWVIVAAYMSLSQRLITSSVILDFVLQRLHDIGFDFANDEVGTAPTGRSLLDLFQRGLIKLRTSKVSFVKFWLDRLAQETPSAAWELWEGQPRNIDDMLLVLQNAQEEMVSWDPDAFRIQLRAYHVYEEVLAACMTTGVHVFRSAIETAPLTGSLSLADLLMRRVAAAVAYYEPQLGGLP